MHGHGSSLGMIFSGCGNFVVVVSSRKYTPKQFGLRFALFCALCSVYFLAEVLFIHSPLFFFYANNFYTSTRKLKTNFRISSLPNDFPKFYLKYTLGILFNSSSGQV